MIPEPGERFEATTRLGDKHIFKILGVDIYAPAPYKIVLKKENGKHIWVEKEWFNQRKIKPLNHQPHRG